MSEAATRAAAGPEPMGPPAAHAVGIGPGDPACLTGRGRALLGEADVVVGFESVLDYAAEAIGGERLACSYADQTEVLARFGERVADGERGVAALMGDPSVSGYQFLGRVERAVEGPVRVVPGISSLQVAAARARTPAEHATLASLHRRGDPGPDLDRLAADAGDRHLLVIPGPGDLGPADVAAELLARGAPASLDALVFEHLTLAEERRHEHALGALGDADGGFADLSVLVVRAAEPPGGAA